MSALGQIVGIVLDGRGNPVPGATIAVLTQPAVTTSQPGSPLASLFSDVAGTIPLANPFTADNNGNYSCYAASQVYTVQFYGTRINGQYVQEIAVGEVLNVLPSPNNTPVVTHKFFNGYTAATGAFTDTQPAFSDLTGSATSAQLPTPTTLAIGAVKASSGVAHQFLTSINTDGSVSQAQPAFTDISGAATTAQVPAMVASGASHSAGIVPDPGAVAGSVKFLREDATWQVPSSQSTILIDAQVGTTYTVANSDQAKLVTFTNASPVAVTLPQANNGGNFLTGWYATFSNTGAGTVTITPTVSTINGAATFVLKQNQSISVVSDGSNYQISQGMKVVPSTAPANQFATAIDGSGNVSYAQPAFTNISGTAVATQYVTMIGDSGAGGVKGAVPPPAAGDAAALKFLSAAGTWLVPGNGSGIGTVTSIGVALPASTFSVSGSPVTSAGTITGSFVNQNANVFFAGPASGAATTPAWRALVPGDLVSAVNSQVGTTYTVLDGDRGKLVVLNNASPIAVTLPQAGAASTFVAGWSTYFESRGAGLVTITPTTSTIDGAATITLNQNAGIRVFSDGTNYFTVRGRVVSAADLSNGTTGTAGTAVVLATAPTISGATLSSNPLITSAFSTNSSAGLPASVFNAVYIGGSSATPHIGSIYVGDGSGWRLSFSKRNASTDTNLISIYDNGVLACNNGSTITSLPTATVTNNEGWKVNLWGQDYAIGVAAGTLALMTSGVGGVSLFSSSLLPADNGFPDTNAKVSLGADGTLRMAGKLLKYNGIATTANGLASVLGTTVDIVTSTTLSFSQNLVTNCPAGMYLYVIDMPITLNLGSASSGIWGVTVDGNQFLSATVFSAGTTFPNSQFITITDFVTSAGGTITVSGTVTGSVTVNSGSFTLRVRAIFLG